MIRCSRVGQYIECTGKITVRKTDDKLYYMQYGFVALYLSFVVGLRSTLNLPNALMGLHSRLIVSAKTYEVYISSLHYLYM